ncbi:MAG: shikimate dehydrogenase [archaeon]|nr:shikimate dehydrogenase [archaeon]MCP8314656.1 shikimate dehydrogenase [archaeon]MCP8315931.1 shikimate dehydrogenase [archaeon]MCP8319768.1 shikimate dehydrogenase [archaeon]
MISNKTHLCCVIGHPIDKSLSPIMHNEAFRAKDLDYVYLAFDVSESHLKEAVEGLRALRVRGFNVTMPHKVAIMNLLDDIDKGSSLVGAVNTVVNDGGKLIGYNTDVDGIISVLEEKVHSLKGLKALLIGAGGVARACIVALVSKGCKEIIIMNRTLNKAKSMVEELSKKLKMICNVEEITIESLRRAISSVDLLINATPIGTYPNLDESIIPQELIKKDMVVFDVVYNPKKTKLIRDAEKMGAKTIPGYEMFVGQGAASFKLWTGIDAPIDVMRRAVLKALG